MRFSSPRVQAAIGSDGSDVSYYLEGNEKLILERLGQGILLKPSRDTIRLGMVLALFLVATHLPLLVGKVPIPMDVVLRTPLWHSLDEKLPKMGRHGEMGDLTSQVFPWRSYAAEVIRGGEVPLWNPRVLLGAPFVANHQSAVFYPLNFLYYLLPITLAWSLNFLFRAAMALWFGYLFVRNLGGSRLGSVVSGMAFMCSAFMVTWGGWALSDSAVWLPIILYSVDRLRLRPALSHIVLCAFSFAMPVLAGHPEIALYVVMTGSAYAAYRIAFPLQKDSVQPTKRLTFAATFTVVGVIAVCLAAVQILPTLEWIPQLKREIGTDFSWGARKKSELVSIFSRDIGSNPTAVRVIVPEGSSYVGILTLFLAGLAFAHRWRGDIVFFAGLFLFAMDVTYGISVGYKISQALPVLENLPNWRMLLLADFSLAVLAGLGVTALQQKLRDPSPRLLLCWWVVILVIFVACLAASTVLVGRVDRIVPFYRSPWATMLLAIISLIVTLPPMRRFEQRRNVWIGVILTIDLGAFFVGRNMPYYPPDLVMPRPKIYRVFKDEVRHRIASTDGVTPSNIEMVFNFSSPVGYDFVTKRNSQILGLLSTTDPPTSLSSELVANSKGQVLDLMSVKYILATSYNEGYERLMSRPDRYRLIYSDLHVHVFENLTALPKVWLVPTSGVRVALSDETALNMIKDPQFDPRRVVVITAAERSKAVISASFRNPFLAEIIAESYSANTARFRTRSNQAAMLVFSDTFYPGWKVFIDGHAQTLLLVNFLFKGVAVPAGMHEVEFRYEPESFRYGALTSLATVLVIVIVLTAGLWVRRGKAVTSPEPKTAKRSADRARKRGKR